jgi:hypothetical protein
MTFPRSQGDQPSQCPRTMRSPILTLLLSAPSFQEPGPAKDCGTVQLFSALALEYFLHGLGDSEHLCAPLVPANLGERRRRQPEFGDLTRDQRSFLVR